MGLQERREKEKDIRRMVILRSARKLLFAQGFKNVTVNEIAKKSELGKGSIYLYFGSKEEIYSQILMQDIDNFHQRSFALFNNMKTATDSLFEFSLLYADVFLNDPELFRILMTFMLRTDQMNLSDKQYKKIVDTMRQTVEIIGNILKFGIDSKEFPSTINIKYNEFTFWGMLNGIIALHIFSGSEKKRREKIHYAIKSILQIYVKGLKQG